MKALLIWRILNILSLVLGMAVIVILARFFLSPFEMRTKETCPTTVEEVVEMYGPGDWKISPFDRGYKYELEELANGFHKFDLPAGSRLFAYWMIIPLQGDSGGLGMEVAGPTHTELVVDSDGDAESIFSNLYILCE